MTISKKLCDPRIFNSTTTDYVENAEFIYFLYVEASVDEIYVDLWYLLKEI